MIPTFPAGASRADVLIAMARQHGWKHLVAVGVGDGSTSAAVMAAVKYLHMTGIGPWDSAKAERKARIVYEINDRRARIIPAGSALTEVEDGSVDAVFIDGGDAREWMPKVKRGGWIIGTGASGSPDSRELPDSLWAIRVTDQLDAPPEPLSGGKVAFVVGGAECVWDDLEAAGALLGRAPDAWVACNDVGAELPELDAWVTVHGNLFPKWKRRRKRAGHPDAPTWCHDTTEKRIDHYTELALPGQTTFGSSGLFAVKVALIDLGIDKVVMCGMPLDFRPNFFYEGEWFAADDYLPAVQEWEAGIKARVRSMSGRTRDILGAPDAEWLA